MILACPTCDSRYDVTGHPIGQQFRCRCGTVTTLTAPSPQAGLLACPQCGAGVAPTATDCDHCSAALLLKSCPRCLSRVFHGHKHCPECGAELDLAAASSAPIADRPCPRCATLLRSRLVGDVVIDECEHCLGLFLDHVAIQRLVTDRQQARADALVSALPRHEVTVLPPDGKMYVKCPVCHVVMNRRLFATGAGVIIDVCKAHGTFFDVGELPRTIEFVMNGGLEKAHRAEIERARQQAKQDLSSSRFAQMMGSRTPHHIVEPQARSVAGEALVDLLFAIFR